MVKAGVNQLHGQDRHAQPLADPLVAPHVAAEAIAGKERVATEQGVAGPLEVQAVGQVDDLESAARGPRLEMACSPCRTP